MRLVFNNDWAAIKTPNNYRTSPRECAAKEFFYLENILR
jgi:hypothetical protein